MENNAAGKTVDCLFIGHNQEVFSEYEEKVRLVGEDSGVYRNIELGFVWHEKKPYNVSEMFNHMTQGQLTPVSHMNSMNPTIAYLGSYLFRKGYTFDFVNSFQEEKEKLIKLLITENILTIGIITTFYFTFGPILEIINFIRRYNRTAKIILGGPYVTSSVLGEKKKILEKLFSSIIKADFYVNSSQGEIALEKIILALKNDEPIDQIENILYPSNGELKSTRKKREHIQLSQNMIDWSLFDGRMGEHVELRTSISCPFSCSFCGFPEHAGDYQVVDNHAIEGELNHLEEMGVVKSVHFFDDTFNIPEKRFKEILRMMIRNKYSFKWNSFFRCQFADREMVELMKESGCTGVLLGVESGNDEMLKRMNKQASVEKYMKGIELLKEFEIITHSSFIIGFPGETDQTIQDTRNFIEESHSDFFRVNVWYCDPITPIYKQKEKYKIEGTRFEWSHSTMDWKTACNIRNDMFSTIGNSVAAYDYFFDTEIIYHLTSRGMTLQQIKDFFNYFNQGVKDKLNGDNDKELKYSLITKLEKVLFEENIGLKKSHCSNKKKLTNSEKIKKEKKGIITDFDLK
jgi:anaerobic magnesium-protoporphyrin IX monomethyl ester cyclase